MSSLFPFVLLIVMMAFFWFAIIRPAKARQTKQLAFLNTLAPGQEVMTTAGVFGTIKSLDGDTVSLEIAPGVEIKMMKAAIAETKAEGLEEAREFDQQAGIEASPTGEATQASRDAAPSDTAAPEATDSKDSTEGH